MNTPHWSGIFPAVTTKFTPDFQIDFSAITRHLEFQLENGVHGIVMIGTLGENSTLDFEEKLQVVEHAVKVIDGRVPVLAGVAETTTRKAIRFVEEATSIGVDGFMVLPAMQYVADRRETLHHFLSIADHCHLPMMIYNNPVTYGVDITPEMLRVLAEREQFVAIKESSADIRRITDIYASLGDRYRLFIGVDDLALEAFAAGAVGWVAGLVCAFPRETVMLYELTRQGQWDKARQLYRWFMPLLHLDTSTKLVQNIKLVESLVGVGTETVRPPRLPLEGEEREQVVELVKQALEQKPDLD
ncbi:MAG: dihydrodipicolinate synthase family protein [Methanobacteriota archaeon]|nr:MAG: dihydrodipicolinate synthase family protein [Euryarchaeota archaeon]